MSPGIIRATIADGVSIIGVPQGGAIVQPLLSLNNTGALPFTLTVKGQACRVNDPLILMYRIDDPEGAAVIMTLPAPFFYVTECGAAVTTIDLSLRARWVLEFKWDGERFVAQQDACIPA